MFLLNCDIVTKAIKPELVTLGGDDDSILVISVPLAESALMKNLSEHQTLITEHVSDRSNITASLHYGRIKYWAISRQSGY